VPRGHDRTGLACHTDITKRALRGTMPSPAGLRCRKAKGVWPWVPVAMRAMSLECPLRLRVTVITAMVQLACFHHPP